VLLTAVETAVITALACVLVVAAATKLRRPDPVGDAELAPPASAAPGAARLLGLAELTVAAFSLWAPGSVSGFVLASVFAAFAVAHARSWRSGSSGDCRCFGVQDDGTSWGRRLGLTAASAAMAVAAGAAQPPSLAGLAVKDPATAILVAIGASAAAIGWRLGFSSQAAPATVGDRLVRSSALFLEQRFSRRTLLLRVAVTGSALCVAPLRYLLYPGSALAAISPGSCADGLCTDGYTAFCCEIHSGLNTCPPGTFPGGWWMCTDYAGHRLCSEEGVRYYVDCNRIPGELFPGGCQCADDSCAHRRVACNVFRYGQCNTQIGGVTEVVCRMIVCENPSLITALNCSSSVAVDDAVCGHDVPCLEPAAVELAGAGGV
jgi:hypothetical protein